MDNFLKKKLEKIKCKQINIVNIFYKWFLIILKKFKFVLKILFVEKIINLKNY